MLLTLSIENMHGLLQDLYSEMMKMCRPISDVALPLAALGALFFIGSRWPEASLLTYSAC